MGTTQATHKRLNVVECYKMTVCIRSQHTNGAGCRPDEGSVLENRHTTGLKVVAPGLLEKFRLRGVPANNVFKKPCTWNWQADRMNHGTLTYGKEVHNRAGSGGARLA